MSSAEGLNNTSDDENPPIAVSMVAQADQHPAIQGQAPSEPEQQDDGNDDATTIATTTTATPATSAIREANRWATDLRVEAAKATQALRALNSLERRGCTHCLLIT